MIRTSTQALPYRPYRMLLDLQLHLAHPVISFFRVSGLCMFESNADLLLIITLCLHDRKDVRSGTKVGLLCFLT